MKNRLLIYFVVINVVSIIFILIRYPKVITWKILHPESHIHRWQTITSVGDSMPVQRKGILIQTNFRSGSSFFGEIFNQRQDVYYSYEPLVTLNGDDTYEMLNILNSTFSCEIKDASSIKFPKAADGLAATLKQCKIHNVCFRRRMRNLCSPQLCDRPMSCSKCKMLTSNKMSDICRTKPMTVAKVIRLLNLESIEPLMKDEELDLKVVHLIRDPRGIMSSRMNLGMTEGMKSTCSRILANINIGMLDPPEWLRGRYKLIRYEDLALHPEAVTKDVYDYVGLEMTTSMKRWININTMGMTTHTEDPKAQQMWDRRKLMRRKLPPKVFEKAILSNAFTTIRHSNATWRAWTHSLQPAIIEKVQKDCEKLMQVVGYRKVSSFQNITSEDILDILPSYEELD